ncbi:MAG TPA: UDP-N-acetylmuramoyl-L-alanyl-D-glutamate--2,6-diaminopimelate ligase [Candidatus Limnocylindrales bacterium]|nr:UDP-N-acetylmuramoyl-L-alanyl-D-glutamate--2,6-diaminopimelate ligase [Candidatus Limnocylindrales bacterium]
MTQPNRRTLEGLLARFAAEGRLRGTRLGGRPVASADLASTEVTGVTLDSRDVEPGSLFVAIPGQHLDGHDFAAAAIEAGATGLIMERPVPGVAAPQILVDAARKALASAAAWWCGDPSHELTVVGITGTDGKTTTAYLAVAALEAAGLPSGMIGTIATRIGGNTDAHAAHATTPEAPELQRTLRAMVDAGDRVAIIETTSHGLVLDRVAAVAYDIAILTNITHEHLELHGTFEAYREAKLSLFDRLREARHLTKPQPVPATAIVNLDDPSAGLFIGTARDAGARVVTYGTEAAADVRATRIAEDANGLHIEVAGPRGPMTLDLRLSGRFNSHNALAVAALGDVLDLDPARIRAGMAALEVVPGRMERIELGQPFGVVVDFAHSPASLTTVLDLLAPAAAARGGGLIAVFGSAGERDTAKRPQMGRIAGERARLVVVTDEDPRGEDREAILDEIARGAETVGRRRGHDLLLIADRREAIAAAFEAARPGDIVLLAGKGHEQSIIGPDGEQPWDERAVAEELLSRMIGAATPGTSMPPTTPP